jgi:mono/diheme cytochrome c family protein
MRHVLLWVLAGVFGGCERANQAGPAIPIDPAALYAQNCMRCHGTDGRGVEELKKIMPLRDLTDPAFRAQTSNDAITRVIMTGQKQMPAFGGALSEPKIQSLTGYVRRLGVR